MNISVNILDFKHKFNLFEESLISSGFNLSQEVLKDCVSIFLGYKNYAHFTKTVENLKVKCGLSKILSNLSNTFTTSLISHSKKKEELVRTDKNGNIVFEEDVLKRYSHQQFKYGVSQASSYLKRNNVKVSHASLLKAFSAFLGYKNWNKLSAVITAEKNYAYNFFSNNYDEIIEFAFLSIEEGAKKVYFVDLDPAMIVGHYLKTVNQFKHQYKVPLKEILKVKSISKKSISDSIFNNEDVCFISGSQETSRYIYEQFIKNNKGYELR